MSAGLPTSQADRTVRAALFANMQPSAERDMLLSMLDVLVLRAMRADALGEPPVMAAPVAQPASGEVQP